MRLGAGDFAAASDHVRPSTGRVELRSLGASVSPRRRGDTRRHSSCIGCAAELRFLPQMFQTMIVYREKRACLELRPVNPTFFSPVPVCTAPGCEGGGSKTTPISLFFSPATTTRPYLIFRHSKTLCTIGEDAISLQNLFSSLFFPWTRSSARRCGVRARSSFVSCPSWVKPVAPRPSSASPQPLRM